MLVHTVHLLGKYNEILQNARHVHQDNRLVFLMQKDCVIYEV